MLDSAGPVAAEFVPPKPGAPRFLYASGARPLAGFVIKRGIGRGGFGEVYFATSDAGKEVALKRIERNLEVELRGVSQCLNLKHVNLIDLYDIRFDDQGDAWVVMEYVAGSSLKETIDRNPSGLPLDQVEFWFRGLAAGVAYLHDHGIVHRDLKPGNIFQDADCVKIGDYGLSKFISTSRRSGQTESVGTFHYMAPEIGKGAYGKEIDIYALGIMLFEMLTGKLPFDGESSQEIIMKHLTADPDLSVVQQPYRAVIETALRKDPIKRFHSASDMAAALFASTKPGPGGAAVPVDPTNASPRTGFANPYYPATSATPPRTPEEPIAKAFRESAQNLNNWWKHGPLSVPAKAALLAVVIVMLSVQGGRLIPAAVVLGSLYLVYLGLRLIIQAISSPNPTANPPAPYQPYVPALQPLPALPVLSAPVLPASLQVAEQPRYTGWLPVNWELEGRQLIRSKSFQDRLGELTGSLLSSALIAGILSVVMMTIGGTAIDDSANPLAGPVWLWLTTTLGSWMLLVAGKWCETNSGEDVKRRFGMLVLGLAFGAIAFLAGDFLMVKFHDGVIARSLPTSELTRGMFDATGAPGLAAFLAYFGAVFVTVRWWKQTDPLRSRRLRVSSLFTCALAAGLWQLLWPFPQPWGFMLIIAISMATQLSATWITPAERSAALSRRPQQFV